MIQIDIWFYFMMNPYIFISGLICRIVRVKHIWNKPSENDNIIIIMIIINKNKQTN